MKTLTAALMIAAGAVTIGPAAAAEHEVLMLNKGPTGIMVFEPAFVRALPGDSVRFVPQDRGHNAESIDGMLPVGAEPFRGQLNDELVVKLDAPGVYGVKCLPHYGMGMVALIVVGEPGNLAAAMTVRHPGKARPAFEKLFGQTVASR